MASVLDAVVNELANLGWRGFQAVNSRVPESPSPNPEWAPGPLLKSHERSNPPLGWPRETDSLCPRCVAETRNSILRGERDLAELVHGHVGEVKARIAEEDGRLVIRKTCPNHGTFEDLLSIDPEFSRIIESRYPGRDFRTLGDELIHRHGTSTIKYGRGAVLTIDLTNRCNMMCNPCFMDANQVGYVHELTLDEIKQILDDSISFKPRRQMSVQFSGGEPTMSLDFVLANSDKMGGISFQPVSFTGRDEDISDEDRRRRRYTISHMAHEMQRYYGGKIDPYRDWYPLGAMGGFTVLADHLRALNGPDQPSFGGLCCSCHPNCGSSVLLVSNRKTKVWSPITQFFDMERFMKDVALICDTARGKKLTLTQVALSFLRNFDGRKAPSGMTLVEFLKLFNGKMGGSVMGRKEREQDWTILWVGGMWFQDLWTYDFRRTEMCVIPYATQEGEISFCAYNTGVGWRQIVENLHMVARTKDWFETRGRHKIYAGDRPMDVAGVRKLPVVDDTPHTVLGAHVTSSS